MEHESIQSLRNLLLFLAIMVTATTGLNIWFVISAYKINRELHGFFEDLQNQVRGYLAAHNLWSDVVHKVIESGPALFEAGVRLTSSLTNLFQLVDRAGGIGRVVESAKEHAAKKRSPRTPSPNSTEKVKQEAD